MPPPAQSVAWILPAIVVIGWSCLAAWALVVTRWLLGLPVLPYQPRRRVPWGPLDLVLVLAVYLAIPAGLGLVAYLYLGPDVARPPVIYDVHKSTAEHIVAKLIAGGNVWVLGLCGLSAAVVAPIVEEFLFRVLLQGWLESAQRRWRRAMPTLRRSVPGAVGPIFLTSFLFGLMHFRVDTPMRHPLYYICMLIATSLVGLLTMAFAIGLLRFRAKATTVDLGWVPEKLFADVRLGLVAFMAIATPIYTAQITLALLLPKYLAPDPFVLFFLAVVLGILYYRTHRIVPVIVVHMSLNTTSLALAWMLMAK